MQALEGILARENEAKLEVGSEPRLQLRVIPSCLMLGIKYYVDMPTELSPL